MFGGSGGGGAAVACAFGSLGPVAARGGGAFTDVECVVPAGDPRGSAAGVRIFSQRSVNLPGSPRAPKSGVIGGGAMGSENYRIKVNTASQMNILYPNRADPNGSLWEYSRPACERADAGGTFVVC